MPVNRARFVLELRDLASRLDLDRAREVALRHRGRDLGDGANLRRQVGGEEVHVSSEILPRPRGAGHVGLASQAAFDADLACDRRHLVGERRERPGHVVDRLGEGRDLPLGVDGQLGLEIAVRHGGDDLDDPAHLFGQVGRHDVDVVGQVFPGAGDSGHGRLAAEGPFGADLARHARDLGGEGVQLVDHRVDRDLQLEDLAFDVHCDLAGEVAAGDGGRHLGDVADLGGEVRGKEIDVVGQILPRPGDPGDDRLTAQLAFGADLARHARDLGGERAKLFDHRVERLFEVEELPSDVDGDFLRKVAAGDGGRDLGDVAHLSGQVARHEVHAVGEILPRARDTGHHRLAAQLAVGSDLARDAGHLAREAVQLIDHRVDRVLQLQDLALHVHGDLARKVASGDRGRDLGDVAHLGGQVRRHEIHVVGETLPRAGDSRDLGLAAELAFGADLARDARDLARKAVQLVDHRVQGVLELEDLARDVDRDLLRQVAVGDGGRDLRDVAHLGGQVRRHEIDAVGQVLPGARDAQDLGLSAELAFGADLARHARDLGREGVQLIDHRVDRDLQLEDLASHVHRDLAGEIAAGDRRRDLGDVAHLSREVRREQVDVVGQILPRARDAGNGRLAAEPAVGADLARDARHLGREAVQLIDHRVQRFLELEDLAAHADGDLLGEIASRDGGRHLGDVPHLGGQIRRHEIDVVGEVLPRPADAGYLRLAPQLAFGADFARHAGDLAREAVELIDHRVDRVLELEDLAADVHRDLSREVAAGDRGRHLGDVADLRREVSRHGVDAVGQVLPRAGDPGNDRLASQLAFGADLTRHACHFRGERAELVDHRVDGLLELEDLAPYVDGDLARQVTAGDGDRDLGDVPHLRREVRRHGIDAVGQILPDAADARNLRLASELPVRADLARDARHLGREDGQLLDHRVHDVRGA